MLFEASIADVARQHGVNANLVHYSRNLYGPGRLARSEQKAARARIRDASRRSIPNRAATSRH